MGMKMYPGNESEKPKIREIINDLKRTNNISGKTIQVADKGLNCGDNIYNAIQNGDGYIFSQSILKLDEVEKQWVIFALRVDLERRMSILEWSPKWQ